MGVEGTLVECWGILRGRLEYFTGMLRGLCRDAEGTLLGC